MANIGFKRCRVPTSDDGSCARQRLAVSTGVIWTGSDRRVVCLHARLPELSAQSRVFATVVSGPVPARSQAGTGMEVAMSVTTRAVGACAVGTCRFSPSGQPSRSALVPIPMPLQPSVDPADSASASLSLEQALEAVKESAANEQDLAYRFNACLGADDEVPRAHELYREIGMMALEAGFIGLAERFAVLSLQAMPRFGQGFKLLGLALRAAGQLDDAAVCHRYGLPSSVLDRHFSDVRLEMVHSDRTDSAAVTRHVAFSSSRHSLTPPFQLHPRRIPELHADHLNALEAFTVRVLRGRLWFDTFNTVVWDDSGRVVHDATRGYAVIVQGKVGGLEPVHLDGCVCLLGNRNAVNYYHWMNDVLPRLEVLRASGMDLADVDHFVVAPLQYHFHHETLAHFGITGERIHSTRAGEYISCDDLLVPMYGSNSLGMSQGPWNPSFLKREFAPAETVPATRRLYVSRGTEGARGISNEAALVDTLARLGFESVQCETLTVREQAALFAEASVVLGPHGAGLSNVAFCQPGTVVIELFDAHIAPCFWAISAVSGLRHVVHYCGERDVGHGPATDERYHLTADDRRRAGFSVCVDDVVSLLNRLGVYRFDAAC